MLNYFSESFLEKTFAVLEKTIPKDWQEWFINAVSFSRSKAI